LLKLAHDDEIHGGHLGKNKTMRKLMRFWWPAMYRDVSNYVKSCHVCQAYKNPRGLPPGYLLPIKVSEIFEHGPLKETKRGNLHIVTAVDAFTKWAVAKPIKCTTSEELINFLEDNILSNYGVPKILITDRGPQFTSAKSTEFMEDSKIEHRLTTPYHPQLNRIDERFNGTVMRILRAYVEECQSDWDTKMKWSVYLYDTTVHDSTGFSPYQGLYGCDPRSPLRRVHREEILIPASTTEAIT